MKNVSLEEIVKEYESARKAWIDAEERMEDLYGDFGDKYTTQIVQDNKGKVALCPVCDHPLEIPQLDMARCNQCGVSIWVKRHCEAIEEYIICNHGFTNIEHAIVGAIQTDPELQKTILPPQVFSIELYNTAVRPQVMKIIRMYGIIDLELHEE